MNKDLVYDVFIEAEYQRLIKKRKIRRRIRRRSNWTRFKNEYGWQLAIKIPSAIYMLAMPFIFRLKFVSESLDMRGCLTLGMIIATILLGSNLEKMFGGSGHDEKRRGR